MNTTQDIHYTQMPNELMEVLMSKAVNASMKAVLVFIARKTYGFHKPTDEISLTQFEKGTKHTRPTVVASLTKLKDVKLIMQLTKGRSKHSSSEWKIDLCDWEEKLVKMNELVKNSNNQSASQLVKPALHTKESQKIFYNYLKTSPTFEEENPGGGTKPQPPPNTPPHATPPAEVVFRNLLKKAKVRADSGLDRISNSELFPFSRNTDAAVKGIIYYILKYKIFCGTDHPFYKLPQLRDCIFGFLYGVGVIERSNLDYPLDDIVAQAINRWFASTPTEPNNLRLSHFVGGKNNSILINSLDSVMADYGLVWKEDADAYF